jgi:Holliday junction resolvase-like predicted endonuclease
MLTKLHIQKASGEIELFSSDKLRQSLTRSGADKKIIDLIVDEIEEWLITQVKRTKGDKVGEQEDVVSVPSKKIYSMAFSLLRKKTISNAARYKLKSAMMEMGPTGHPFEHFIGEIYRSLGFETEVGITLQGQCVTHEVDVIATKKNHQRFIECKYYQSTGKNANVQVPLYIRSRVDDIINKRKTNPDFKGYSFSGGVVTNTRFTLDAEQYGKCSGLHLLSWDYPKGEGLREIIDRERIFPVTSLSNLTKVHKKTLMDKGVVSCPQLTRDPSLLNLLNLDKRRRAKVLEEAQDLT